MADQAAKKAATKPARNQTDGLSLAYTHRIVTETREQGRQAWLTSALARRSREAQRAYRAGSGGRQDPAVARAPKKVACRYYQLKTGHAAIGTYLQRIKAQDNSSCQWCHAPRETVRHLLFECRQWRPQRRALYRALARARVQSPTAAEDCPEGRLFGDPKATGPLLEFISTTAIGCRRDETVWAAEMVRQDDEWGLEELEEEEREGEG